MDIKTYILSMAMPDRLKFAKRCETSYPHLRNIAYGQKPCGEKLCIAIERESRGAVRCEDMRPDVDWAYLRGTARPDAYAATPVCGESVPAAAAESDVVAGPGELGATDEKRIDPERRKVARRKIPDRRTGQKGRRGANHVDGA